MLHTNIFHRTSSKICQLILLDSFHLLPRCRRCRRRRLRHCRPSRKEPGTCNHFNSILSSISPTATIPSRSPSPSSLFNIFIPSFPVTHPFLFRRYFSCAFCLFSFSFPNAISSYISLQFERLPSLEIGYPFCSLLNWLRDPNVVSLTPGTFC